MPSTGSGADSPGVPDSDSQATPAMDTASPATHRDDSRSPKMAHAPTATNSGTREETIPAWEDVVRLMAYPSSRK